MSRQAPFQTSLVDFSEVVADSDSASVAEYAAMGLLVDWELVKFLDRLGWSLLRLSFSFKVDEVLLVVKIRVDDTQQVVFVSSSSPIGCIRTFVRRLRENTLTLYPDKFA
jgi:hypothetical protein